MVNRIITKNNTKLQISEIPIFPINELRELIIEENKRPISFFGKDWGEGRTRLFVVLADDVNGEFVISSAIFEANEKSYESLTQNIPAFHIFEREFYENFGIEPLNHPWLKPVRKNQKDYPFFEMEGEEVHQVAVGPIHAGVIEPGHFRFMCNGENVYHLEIMLGYQHRGVEELMLNAPSNQLAESICGDSVIAYNTAYSQIMEQLKNITVSDKAQLIRKLALEMERAAIHIGDLGAIAGDIAYLMGASVFGATRTLVINTMLEFSGSRFGRGLINVGGVNFDLDNEKIERAKATLDKVEKDVVRMCETMLKNTSVMSRLEKTGTVSTEKATEIGLVGMAAKASGVNLDTRFDYPDKWINNLNIQRKQFRGVGDVNSRFKLRYKEIRESFAIIRKCFNELEKHKNEPIMLNNITENEKNAFAISVVEAWRGELVHIAMTDEFGKLSCYKIKDPSFNNWYGLALAVRNNGISDFPLCNKSFNLSYAGNDL
ncbi:NADH-quinone oxidoreductase subunit C [bacterium]|nr:NADH-quinone oxidoreductase subunit C [bacterium]